MSKSYVRELCNVFSALFKDALDTYPALKADFDKDQSRLQVAVANRGIGVFLRDLPALGQHLDRCVSNGEFKLSGLPLSGKVSKRIVIPKLFRGLYQLIFDDDGCLKEDCDVQALLVLRQFLYCAKKAKLRCGADKVAKEIRNFISVDASLPEPTPFWSQASVSVSDIRSTFVGFSKEPRIRDRLKADAYTRESTAADLSIFLRNLDTVSGLLSSAIGSFDSTTSSFKHGPGVVSDLEKYEDKYVFNNWPDRLNSAFPWSDCAFHSWAHWAYHCIYYASDLSQDEKSSKLGTVPKTYAKPRLIAAEPHENMWCQQSVKRHMYDRVERTWIGSFVQFQDQSLNQRLCKRGSMDGSLATIDLSAASDRVSCCVVGNMFRGNASLLMALQASRTLSVDYTDESGSDVRLNLNKYSTMGNATTFPVESLLFLGVALAACLTQHGKAPTLQNVMGYVEKVSVFGDDIIVPGDCRILLTDALELLWFQVNTDKSYWNGLFRESCGVDSYKGVDVTPLYWKAPYAGQPKEYVSTLAASNNFYKKWYLHTAEYLFSTISAEHSVPLVPYSSGFPGGLSRVSPRTWPFKARYNNDLQRTECLVTLPIGKQAKRPIEGFSAILQYFTEVPDPTTSWQSGVPQKPSLKLRRRWVPVTDLSS